MLQNRNLIRNLYQNKQAQSAEKTNKDLGKLYKFETKVLKINFIEATQLKNIYS